MDKSKDIKKEWEDSTHVKDYLHRYFNLQIVCPSSSASTTFRPQKPLQNENMLQKIKDIRYDDGKKANPMTNP